MAELVETPAVEGLPVEIGAVDITLLPLRPMMSVAPFKGKEADVAAALGHSLPKIGRSLTKDRTEICWFSRGQWMLIGALPAADIANNAAVTDQSDAWCALRLKGADAEAVLARLVPVDLRQTQIKRGHCLRSQLGHMNVHITRTGNDAFRIMGFRSMAQTMVHELRRAMSAVEARG